MPPVPTAAYLTRSGTRSLLTLVGLRAHSMIPVRAPRRGDLAARRGWARLHLPERLQRLGLGRRVDGRLRSDERAARAAPRRRRRALRAAPVRRGAGGWRYRRRALAQPGRRLPGAWRRARARTGGRLRLHEGDDARGRLPD